MSANASIWSPGSTAVVSPANSITVQHISVTDTAQSVFNITEFSYVPATGSLHVFLNGVLQRLGIDYLEQSETEISWISPAFTVGDTVTCLGFVELSASQANPYGTSFQSFVATAGQTAFTITSSAYVWDNGSLRVYLDGVLQARGDAYVITGAGNDVITFSEALWADAEVLALFNSEVGIGNEAAYVGYIPAGTGAVARDVQGKLREFVSVKDFGAVGDGVADDTAAVQNALNSVGSNGAVLFSVGTYKITSTLTYAGDPANAITLYSDSSPGRGFTGANILWAGASGGTILSMTAANNCLIKNLSFRGEGIAAVLLKLNHPSSSGVMIDGCIFNNAAGTNSAMLQLGDSSNQVSEVRVRNCVFQCSSSQSTYGILTATGNVKNFYIDGCIFNGMQYGITFGSSLYGSASGVMVVSYCVAAGITVSDFYVRGGGGSLTVIGHESEGGVRFITGAGQISGPNTITCIGCQIQAFNCPSDDFIIYNLSSKFTLIGNSFENTRVAGTSIPKVWVSNTYSGTPAGSITSLNNVYVNAKQRAPIWESAGNWLLDPFNGPYNSWKGHILSQGDAGGYSAAPVKLDDCMSDMHVSNVGASSYQLSSDATLNESGYLSRSVYKVTIPYTAWKVAATTQGLSIGTLPGSNNCRVVGVWADTTQAYAGLAGTITLSVGTSSGGTDFLLAKDVKTAATQQGLVDADLGSSLARASAVQGGYMVWKADKGLYATLVSGTGNIGTGTATNLSAGSTTVYVITESLP